MSIHAQVNAFHEMEEFCYGVGIEDEGSDWYVYLRTLGWTDEQVYGLSARPEFTDETIAKCPGIVYSCIF
jgi:hypothetical protein